MIARIKRWLGLEPQYVRNFDIGKERRSAAVAKGNATRARLRAMAKVNSNG